MKGLSDLNNDFDQYLSQAKSNKASSYEYIYKSKTKNGKVTFQITLDYNNNNNNKTYKISITR